MDDLKDQSRRRKEAESRIEALEAELTRIKGEFETASGELTGYKTKEAKDKALQKVLGSDKFRGYDIDREKLDLAMSKLVVNMDTIEADIADAVWLAASKPVGSGLDAGGVGNTEKAMRGKNAEKADTDPIGAMFLKIGGRD